MFTNLLTYLPSTYFLKHPIERRIEVLLLKKKLKAYGRVTLLTKRIERLVKIWFPIAIILMLVVGGKPTFWCAVPLVVSVSISRALYIVDWGPENEFL